MSGEFLLKATFTFLMIALMLIIYNAVDRVDETIFKLIGASTILAMITITLWSWTL